MPEFSRESIAGILGPQVLADPRASGFVPGQLSMQFGQALQGISGGSLVASQSPLLQGLRGQPSSQPVTGVVPPVPQPTAPRSVSTRVLQGRR